MQDTVRIDNENGFRSKGHRARALTVLFIAAASATVGSADSTCTVQRPGLPRRASIIGVAPSVSLPDGTLQRAIAHWGQCANYGSGFPVFAPGSNGDQRLSVRYRPNEIGANKCGSFAGREIQLYRRARLPEGRIANCGSLELNLAHELGHALGLGDTGRNRLCDRHVMANINRRNEFSRRVTKEECRVVGARWLTPGEIATDLAAGGLASRRRVP